MKLKHSEFIKTQRSHGGLDLCNLLFIQFLTDRILKERLEIDTLQDVGTLKNKNFQTKFIKVKTKL